MENPFFEKEKKMTLDDLQEWKAQGMTREEMQNKLDEMATQNGITDESAQEDFRQLWNEYIQTGDDGYTMDDWIYSGDETDEIFYGKTPTEILTTAYYGHDWDYTGERDARNYEEYNPNRPFFTFNGYGNLLSIPYIYSPKFANNPISLKSIIGYVFEN